MKILVTGVKGQLGYDVVKELELNGIEAIGCDIEDFDLTNKEETQDFIFANKPDGVIHCAAYTAVDKAAADYAKYDLLAAKGALLAVYTTDTDAEVRSLRKQINSATSLAELESILYAYVAETHDTEAKAVATATIYDFDRLASVN